MEKKTTSQNLSPYHAYKKGKEIGKTSKNPKDFADKMLDELKEEKQIILNKRARRSKIATRLKEIRISHKLTQKNICDTLTLSPLTYSNYEKERNDVPVEILIQLADMYEVSMDYLTCRTDNPKGIYFSADGIDNKEESNDNIEARIAKLEEAIEKLKSI